MRRPVVCLRCGLRLREGDPVLVGGMHDTRSHAAGGTLVHLEEGQWRGVIYCAPCLIPDAELAREEFS